MRLIRGTGRGYPIPRPATSSRPGRSSSTAGRRGRVASVMTNGRERGGCGRREAAQRTVRRGTVAAVRPLGEGVGPGRAAVSLRLPHRFPHARGDRSLGQRASEVVDQPRPRDEFGVGAQRERRGVSETASRPAERSAPFEVASVRTASPQIIDDLSGGLDRCRLPLRWPCRLPPCLVARRSWPFGRRRCPPTGRNRPFVAIGPRGRQQTGRPRGACAGPAGSSA